MKSKWLSFLAASLFFVLLAIGLYFWSNYHRASVEQRAYELMTETTQSVLGSGDWGPVLENMTPEAPIQSPDMSTLQYFGPLVALGELEGAAEVPPLFSGEPATAQLRMTGHFRNGGAFTEAILVYQEGRWMFSHFAYIPGNLAQ